MHVSTAIVAFLAPLSLAVPSAYRRAWVGPYEAIHQRESILAETLDTKDWDRLGESMTQNVVYDSRLLGPDYGGLSVGLDEVIANTKAAFGDASVAHHVSNAIIRLNDDETEANVTTYIVWSRWDSTALYDVRKTFRVFERCDDKFVLDNGNWKLKYSLVSNLEQQVERPFFGDGGHGR